MARLTMASSSLELRGESSKFLQRGQTATEDFIRPGFAKCGSLFPLLWLLRFWVGGVVWLLLSGARSARRISKITCCGSPLLSLCRFGVAHYCFGSGLVDYGGVVWLVLSGARSARRISKITCRVSPLLWLFRFWVGGVVWLLLSGARSARRISKITCRGSPLLWLFRFWVGGVVWLLLSGAHPARQISKITCRGSQFLWLCRAEVAYPEKVDEPRNGYSSEFSF